MVCSRARRCSTAYPFACHVEPSADLLNGFGQPIGFDELEENILQDVFRFARVIDSPSDEARRQVARENGLQPHQHLAGATPMEAWLGIDPFRGNVKSIRWMSFWDGRLAGYWLRR